MFFVVFCCVLMFFDVFSMIFVVFQCFLLFFDEFSIFLLFSVVF